VQSGTVNTGTGGTTLEAGTPDLAAVGAAGTGAITFAGKATLAVENVALSGTTFANPIDAFARHDIIDLTWPHVPRRGRPPRTTRPTIT
jgi:hypothetical protein